MTSEEVIARLLSSEYGSTALLNAIEEAIDLGMTDLVDDRLAKEDIRLAQVERNTERDVEIEIDQRWWDCHWPDFWREDRANIDARGHHRTGILHTPKSLERFQRLALKLFPGVRGKVKLREERDTA